MATGEKWVTINGAHVLIGADGEVKKGPASIKKSAEKKTDAGKTAVSKIPKTKDVGGFTPGHIGSSQKVVRYEVYKDGKLHTANFGYYDDVVKGQKELKAQYERIKGVKVVFK